MIVPAERFPQIGGVLGPQLFQPAVTAFEHDRTRTLAPASDRTGKPIGWPVCGCGSELSVMVRSAFDLRQKTCSAPGS